MNLINYYKLLYQATGEFKLYGKAMYTVTFLLFCINVILLFLVKTDAFIYYLIGYIVLYYAVCVFLEIQFRRNHAVAKGKLFSKSLLIGNIKSGFPLTLGNLSSIILTSMDRWFVKALMDNSYFALYSFAVTVEAFLNTAITPVTTTLYNFFCREKDEEKHRNIFKYSLVLATVLPACGFAVKFILEVYLQNYMASSPVVFWLFAAQIFYIVIKSIFVNLYEAQKRQKVYFLKLVSVIVIGFVLNAGLYMLLGTMESFAIATFICAVTWFVICCFDFKYLRISVKEYAFIALSVVLFLVAGLFFKAIPGLLIYIAGLLLLMVLLLKKTLMQIIDYCKAYLKRRKSRAEE